MPITPVVTMPVMNRLDSGKLLFIENFRSPAQGAWNDGLGSASRDWNVPFAGLPSIKLDTQGQSSGGATNPGRTANTSGVVFKRRIQDNFTGKFGVACWFRFSSTNLTGNTFFSLSLYNRDGTNAHHGRVWLDLNGNNANMHGRILDGVASSGGTATFADVVTSDLQYGGGSHLWEPISGRLDRAGGWHYAKLIVDIRPTINKYVSLQLDGRLVDCTGYSLDDTASTGAAMMHFSVEFVASTATVPRYMHIAQLTGTVE